jgi:hypothetical protein
MCSSDKAVNVAGISLRIRQHGTKSGQLELLAEAERKGAVL